MSGLHPFSWRGFVVSPLPAGEGAAVYLPGYEEPVAFTLEWPPGEGPLLQAVRAALILAELTGESDAFIADLQAALQAAPPLAH